MRVAQVIARLREGRLPPRDGSRPCRTGLSSGTIGYYYPCSLLLEVLLANVGNEPAGSAYLSKAVIAMATAVAPIKVSGATDELISHAAHFMCTSKKNVVDAAIREYIENHRDEINASVRSALAQLNGTTQSAVALLSGLSEDELADVGGLPG